MPNYNGFNFGLEKPDAQKVLDDLKEGIEAGTILIQAIETSSKRTPADWQIDSVTFSFTKKTEDAP
jgi:hypothetical protein